MDNFVSGVMSYFWPAFDKNQAKILMKSTLIRLKIMKPKINESVKQQKAVIAQLIKNGKDELARIKVEHIIRDEELLQAYEIVELLIEKVQARLDMLEMHQHCPDELLEAVHTVIYCAPLISDIAELSKLNVQFSYKYGKETVEDIILRPSPFINQQVKYKLAVKQPDQCLVEQYLCSIMGPDHHHHMQPPPSVPPDNCGNCGDGGNTERLPSYPPPYPGQNQTFTPSAPILGSSNLFPPNMSVPPNMINQMPPPNMTNQMPPPNMINQNPPPNIINQNPPPNMTNQMPPPNMTNQNPPPTNQTSFPQPPNNMPPSGDKNMDLDDLTARFEALKKKTNRT